MTPPRVVLDTNALLQILGTRSPYHFLFRAFLDGAFNLCVSTEILLEYEEILRQQASRTAADLFLKVLAYSPNVIHGTPYFQFHLVTRDPDDNKFTDCAIVTQADCLVTDDSHFREAADCPFPHVNIMGLDAFADLIRSAPGPDTGSP